MGAPGARKMVNLAINETSGVDHPAHLSEGWLVMKAADPAAVEAAIEKSMSGEVPMTVEEQLAAAQERIAELEGQVAKHAGETPEPEVDDLVKAAPEPVRKMIEDMQKATDEAVAKSAAAEETLHKERGERLDAEAVAKAASDFEALGLDAAQVGPTLRRLNEADPDLAKAVETALLAANAKVESADIFTELGKSATRGFSGAEEKATAMAKSAVESGAAETFEQALAGVWKNNPDLYTEHLAEKGN